MPYYAILHPDILWQDIDTIYRTSQVGAQTPEQEGFCRIATLAPPPYGEFCLEATGDSVFVLPSGALLGTIQ